MDDLRTTTDGRGSCGEKPVGAGLSVTVLITPAAVAALVDQLEPLLRDRLAAGREPELTEFLTVDEAAALLRCRRARIYDLVSARRLPRLKDGSRVLIRRADIDAYFERETREPR